MRLSRLLAVIAIVSCAGYATAAPAPAPAAPPAAAERALSPEATDLARLLITKEMWKQGVEQISSNVQMRLEGHPGSTKLKYPADLGTRVRSEVEGALPYEELVTMHAQRLNASYTAPELKELLAFHRTPAGKKWLQVQPQNFEAVGAETEQRMQQKLPEIMTKLGKLAEKPAGAPAAGSKAPAAKKK